MHICQQGIAIALMLCLPPLPMNDLVASAEARPGRDPSAISKKVALLGVGSKVKVEVQVGGAEGSSRGTIEAIEEEEFVLATEQPVSHRRIRYDQVVRLQLVKRSYKAVGQPDPVEVRRVVLDQAGRLVKVRLTDGRQITGRIQVVRQDCFFVSGGEHEMPTRITYTDVQQVKGKRSAAKIAQWAIYPLLLVGVLLLAGLAHAAEQATH